MYIIKHQSINQSISQSISQSINQSVNQSINQSINHSVNQSISKTPASYHVYPFFHLSLSLSLGSITQLVSSSSSPRIETNNKLQKFDSVFLFPVHKFRLYTVSIVSSDTCILIYYLQ